MRAQVAEEAAAKSITTDEALSLVHPHERPLIPNIVMDQVSVLSGP